MYLNVQLYALNAVFPRTHYIGGYVGVTVDLDIMTKEKLQLITVIDEAHHSTLRR
jgi:hypothetical protein